MGQLPDGAVHLVETIEDARSLKPKNGDKLAYVTQTTLSVDDTGEIVAVLKERFPAIRSAPREDICYATTNRQHAVKHVAGRCDALFVVGAPNSSNSQRLKEVALRAGCPQATLIQRATDIDWPALEGARNVAITAGASAPEILVEEVVAAFREHFDVTVEMVRTAEENMSFNLPRELRSSAAE
jgi:4-hydroxy-3-methylbut-2-enyl diphosphate reductase